MSMEEIRGESGLTDDILEAASDRWGGVADDRARVYLCALATHGTHRWACAAADVHVLMAAEWARTLPGFEEALEDAKRLRRTLFEDEGVERALAGCEDAKSADLLKLMLTAHDERYRGNKGADEAGETFRVTVLGPGAAAPEGGGGPGAPSGGSAAVRDAGVG